MLNLYKSILVKSTILPFIFAILFWMLSLGAQGQKSSGRAYEFLSIPPSARISAMGGLAPAINDKDLSIALQNPAFLSPETSTKLLFSFLDSYDGISMGNFGYAQSFGNIGMASLGIQYLNYGTFTETDNTGEILGDFTASEFAATLGYSKMLHPTLVLGSHVKIISSQLYEYQSVGLAADLAVAYLHPNGLFAASLIARNMGRQVQNFRAGEREPLPFDLQLSFSQKLQNAPFRLYAVAHNLHRFDLTYDYNAQTYNPFGSTNQNTRSKVEDIADKCMRHLIMGIEVIPSKNFFATISYNYRRRQEMKITGRTALTGFAWGLGIRVSKFQLSYGNSINHIHGAPHHITLSTKISDFLPSPQTIISEP